MKIVTDLVTFAFYTGVVQGFLFDYKEYDVSYMYVVKCGVSYMCVVQGESYMYVVKCG